MLSAVTPGNDAHREHHVGDTGRQGPLDAARAAIVPDSMKSDSQVAKDHTRGKADDFGSHLQPQGTKSTGQDFIDSKLTLTVISHQLASVLTALCIQPSLQAKILTAIIMSATEAVKVLSTQLELLSFQTP